MRMYKKIDFNKFEEKKNHRAGKCVINHSLNLFVAKYLSNLDA